MSEEACHPNLFMFKMKGVELLQLAEFVWGVCVLSLPQSRRWQAKSDPSSSLA